MYKLDLEKAKEPEIKLPTFIGSQKKEGNSRKTSISASLTKLKPLPVWITTNCGKFLKRWEYQACILRNLHAGQEETVRTKYGTIDWFKIGKAVNQAIECHSVYLTYVQSTSCKILGWMSYELESSFLGEIPTT